MSSNPSVPPPSNGASNFGECDISEEKLFSLLDRKDPFLEDHLPNCELCRGRAAELGKIIDVISFEGNAESKQIPEIIDQYRIKSWLGEGASSVVYEAVQTDPERTVALKVIKGGELAAPDMRRLFEREVRSLARMRHPGIAQIYQAGNTEDGHMWLAIELVEGSPLNKFVADNNLTNKEILSLFRQVCEAVHYTHGRGIIHRDLKPSNILVSRAPHGEGGFQVKVLDFGLARIEDAEASQGKTRKGKVLGTLQYMSPEQAAGEIDDIDVRTDVFSLGVILYEILVGQRPYSVPSSSLAKAIRVIAEAKVAPMNLPRGFADLTIIVNKSLQKDLEQRYSSVAAFADDLERFQFGLPILARPPSFRYEFVKLVMRNKAISLAISLLLLVSVGSLIKTQRDAANIYQQSQQLKRVTRLVLETFGADDAEELGPETKVLDILPSFAEKLKEELNEFPSLQLTLLRSVGVLYRNLGEYKKATAEMERAMWIAEKSGDHIEIGKSANQLAVLVRELGDLERAEQLTRKALDSFNQNPLENQKSIIHCLNNLSRIMLASGRVIEAKQVASNALDEMNIGDQDNRLLFAVTQINLGNACMSQGEFAEAREFFRGAQDIREQMLGRDSRGFATSLVLSAWAERELGNLAQAEELCREALQIDIDILGEDHPATARTQMSLAKAILKRSQLSLSRLSEALELCESSEAVYESTFDADHAFTLEAKQLVAEASARLKEVKNN